MRILNYEWEEILTTEITKIAKGDRAENGSIYGGSCGNR